MKPFVTVGILGNLLGLLSSTGGFLQEFFAVELEPRHMLFISIGKNIFLGGVILALVLAVISDFTSLQPDLSFNISLAMTLLGVFSIGVGVYDSRESQRLERERKREKLEQERAESKRAWAEAGMYEAGRASLEEREDAVFKVGDENREFEVERRTFETQYEKRNNRKTEEDSEVEESHEDDSSQSQELEKDD